MSVYCCGGLKCRPKGDRRSLTEDLLRKNHLDIYFETQSPPSTFPRCQRTVLCLMEPAITPKPRLFFKINLARKKHPAA